jgi:uncharacterized membrane protein (UPF0136 family)
MTIVGLVALGLYSTLLAVGGVIGYVKAGSQPSLIAGLASAVAIDAALVVAVLVSPQTGFGIALVIAAVLTVVFFGRWQKTGKVMPGGMLCFLSAAMTTLLAALLVTAA